MGQGGIARLFHLLSGILLTALLAGVSLLAQTSIRGSVRPQAQRANDLGPMAGDTRLSALRISIKPSGEQQLGLEKTIADQRDPISPSYHRWLTPEQFGARFGISAANETVMRRWLASQGFGNVKLAKSRTAFYFAGTVAQAQQAFHTRIDSLMVDGERHLRTLPNFRSG